METISQVQFLQELSYVNSVLGAKDSIVLYFSPILEDGVIVNYQFDFISENFLQYQQGSDTTQVGDLLTEKFPESKYNGAVEIFNACLQKEGLIIPFERPLTINNQLVWFHSNAVKRYDGILVTCKDITELKETENQLRKSNEQLQFQNTILNDAERISQTASFRWNIQKNQWLYSENMYHLLNIGKEELNAKPIGILDMLEPEEATKFQRKILEHQHQDTLPPCEFSLVKETGVHHYTMNGNFVPVPDGQLLLGVLQDRTDIVRNELLLKEKNTELQRSNIELDSFNHIASHDLQEPLRKIRMFISRLEDLDAESFNTRGKSYLSKIEHSSERMQQLIRHLLTYSRIGKAKQVEKALNLNRIVDEILQDYSLRIEESNAEMHVGTLPTIPGSAFSIHQLFANLISNALKYVKDGTRPVIHITGKTALRKDITIPNFVPKHPEYAHLTIKDNGIGFSSIYAEKIFELFQRLHQNSEYNGTGIGLAICKKIALVHEGYIYPISKIGEGSEFHVYLPTSKE